MLSNLTPRPYQEVIFASCVNQNTLVVLPTGLGKTAIAMMLAARRFMLYPKSKIVFLAPTKPLVEQQLNAFKEKFLFSEDKFALFTGSTPPAKRKKMWDEATLIFSTPQTLENDVLGDKISLKDVSLMIFDEAHRASGDYAYVFLASEYVKQATYQRILALTASPGSDKESIDNVMDNLFLEKIEFRRLSDSDVKDFTQETTVVWENVILPNKIQRIVDYLSLAYKDKLNQVNNFGFLSRSPDSYTKMNLLMLQQKLHAQLQQERASIELFQSISLLAQALKIKHSLELAQTQSVHALHEYLYGLLSSSRTTKTKAVKNLVIDPNFLSALSITRDLIKEGIEHPKLDLLKQRVFDLIEKKPDAKIIIFSQFRDSATKIQEWINPISSSLFFGQAKKNGVGFSQKKQKEVLDNFKSGKFSCLIATSVAEEGLDIPSVDQVFFFEPVPSAIRSVQRRGRTGRHTKGFVTVLVTKGTQDEANRWVSFHKEKRMFSVLDSFSKTSNTKKSLPQKSLSSFTDKLDDSNDKSVTIVVDHREKGSPVLKALRSLGVSIELKQLQVGDFVISKDACVEYKQYRDLLDSIVDGRLLVQLRSLAQYKKPILLLEGDATPSNLRRVNKSAIQGMITTIALSYRIPIIRTFSSLESAQFLQIMASREQLNHQQEFTYHSSKPLTDKELLEYVVSSLPNIGGSLAKSLLDSFDNLQELLHASVDDLKNVDLIGEKKAHELNRLFSLSYKSTKDNSYR